MPVPALVVVPHDRHDRIAKIYVREHVGADDRVHLHLLELVLRELARLVQDVSRYSDLADVVQQRAGLQRLDFQFGQSNCSPIRRANSFTRWMWS